MSGEPMYDISILQESFIQALISVDKERAESIVAEVLEKDSCGITDVDNLIIMALNIIGEGWEQDTYSLSQVYMSGIICEELFASLNLEHRDIHDEMPKMGIAVFLDHHALGKRMVLSILRASGYTVFDLGEALSLDELIQKVLEQKIEILILSMLMLPSALKVKLVRERFDALNIPIKIIVGGAPYRFDKNLWHKVGADADGKNASDIVNVIEKVVAAL